MTPEEKKLRRDLRESRKFLRDLCMAVTGHLMVVDHLMKGPSTDERGRQIAAACNQLELAKDIAFRFGVNRTFKPKKRA